MVVNIRSPGRFLDNALFVIQVSTFINEIQTHLGTCMVLDECKLMFEGLSGIIPMRSNFFISTRKRS
mgnify:FL=1